MTVIKELLKQCSEDSISRRKEAYCALIELFSSGTKNDTSFNIHSTVASKIISNIITDINECSSKTTYEALGLLGFYICNDSLMDLLGVSEEELLLDSLLKLIPVTNDKDTLSRCLWCISESKFEFEVYEKNFKRIVETVMVLNQNPSNLIIQGCLSVLNILVETIPRQMIGIADSWFLKLFFYLFHQCQKIRTSAYNCLDMYSIYFKQIDNSIGTSIHENIVKLIPDLKNDYIPIMVKLVGENCSCVLEIWRFIVLSLGTSLHNDKALINKLLLVAERAFKSSNTENRVGAFKCWQALINNFSSKISPANSQLKLLVAPLKTDNSKTEDVAKIKIQTWWLLIKYVSSAGDHIDIVISLLKFCFNPNKYLKLCTNERSLLMSTSSLPCIKHPSLILECSEVLSSTLISGFKYPDDFIMLNLPKISNIILSSTNFIKYSNTIFGCIADLLSILDASNQTQFNCGLTVLQCTLMRIALILEQYPNKAESVDLVKDFFRLFTFVIKCGELEENMSDFAFKFFEYVILGDYAFSSNILNSRFYNIPIEGRVKDLMVSNLYSYLIHHFCKPAILRHGSKERFLDIWANLLSNCKSIENILYLNNVVKEMESASTDAKDLKSLNYMWVAVAQQMNIHMVEIQHFDDSEHDIGCIHNILYFPVELLSKFNNCQKTLSEISDVSVAWSKIWQHLTTITSISSNTSPNGEAEFLCHKLLTFVSKSFNESSYDSDAAAPLIALLSFIVKAVITEFRFKDMIKVNRKDTSPIKSKRIHPLHSLKSCVDLLILLFEKSLKIVSFWRNLTVRYQCHSFIYLFKHINQDAAFHEIVLQSHDVLKTALMINPTAVFDSQTESALLEMWHSFCDVLEKSIVPRLSQDTFSILSPLITVALRSTHEQIKNRTRVLWKKSFSQTSLILPVDLLDAVKEVNMSESVSDESVFFNSTKISPGNFLDNNMWSTITWKQDHKSNELKSPNRSKKLNFNSSPNKKDMQKTPTNSSLAFRGPLQPRNFKTPVINDIGDFHSEEFVKVSSPKPSKRVLTPHQLEKMRKRADDIPALYNDLSQNTQLSQNTPDFVANSQVTLNSSDSMKVSDLTFEGKFCDKDRAISSDFQDENNVFSNSTSLKNNESRSVNTSDSVINSNTIPNKPISDFQIFKNSIPSKKLDTPLCGDLTKSSDCVSSHNTNVHKRKSDTPHKKSLEDIKIALKQNHIKNRTHSDDLHKSKQMCPNFKKQLASSQEHKSTVCTLTKSPQRIADKSANVKEKKNVSLNEKSSTECLERNLNDSYNRPVTQENNLSVFKSSQKEDNNSRSDTSPMLVADEMNDTRENDDGIFNNNTSISLSDFEIEGVPTKLPDIGENILKMSAKKKRFRKSFDFHILNSTDVNQKTASSDDRMTRSGRRIVPPKKLRSENSKFRSNRHIEKLGLSPRINERSRRFTLDCSYATAKGATINNNMDVCKTSSSSDSAPSTPVVSQLPEENDLTFKNSNEIEMSENEHSFKKSLVSISTEDNLDRTKRSSSLASPQEYPQTEKKLCGATGEIQKSEGSPLSSPKKVKRQGPVLRNELKMRQSDGICVTGSDASKNQMSDNYIVKNSIPIYQRAKRGRPKKNKNLISLKTHKNKGAEDILNGILNPSSFDKSCASQTKNVLAIEEELRTNLSSVKDSNRVLSSAGESNPISTLDADSGKTEKIDKVFTSDTISNNAVLKNNIKQNEPCLTSTSKENIDTTKCDHHVKQSPHINNSSDPNQAETRKDLSEECENITTPEKDSPSTNLKFKLYCDTNIDNKSSEWKMVNMSVSGDDLISESNSNAKNKEYENSEQSNSHEFDDASVNPNCDSGNKSDIDKSRPSVIVSTPPKHVSNPSKPLSSNIDLDSNAIHNKMSVEKNIKSLSETPISVVCRSPQSSSSPSIELKLKKFHFRGDIEKNSDMAEVEDLGVKECKSPKLPCEEKKSTDDDNDAMDIKQDTNGDEINIISQKHELENEIENSNDKLSTLNNICSIDTLLSSIKDTTKAINKNDSKDISMVSHIPGSRAAMMIACAKKHFKGRAEESAECSGKNEAVSSVDEQSSDTPNKIKIDTNPTIFRHKPSPRMSPSGSILKRKLDDENTDEMGNFGDYSPSVTKKRRVSFADPPVAISVEIPSPKVKKYRRAQKRLDMTSALAKTNDTEKENIINNQQSNLPSSFYSASSPICASFVSCPLPVRLLISAIASESQSAENLTDVLLERNVKTIGEFCALTNTELKLLPFEFPDASELENHLKNIEQSYDDDELNEAKEEKHTAYDKAPDANLQQTVADCRPSVTVVRPEDDVKEESANVDQGASSGHHGSVKDLFTVIFSEDFEKNIDSIIRKLDAGVNTKILEAILASLPYQNVIDVFHKYLAKR